MDLRTRVESDQHMSTAWIIVPLLPIIGVILLAVGFAIALFSAISGLSGPTPRPGPLSGLLATLFLFYLLVYIRIPVIVAISAIMFQHSIHRQRFPFQRQNILYRELITLVKQIA